MSTSVRERLAAALARSGQPFDDAQWELRGDELAFFAQDVYGDGAAPLAVLRAKDADTLARQVGALTAAGHPIVARGGGLSYTGGFLADHPGAVLVDTRGLDRVVEVNATDRYVRVQAGATWAALDAALEPHGLRTPYWGPLSGFGATVGGALSQGSVFLGSGLHGSVGDSVLALEVVTAEGQRLRTGAWAAAHSAPFFRYFGPDLTGLFVGDCGSLGLKTEASLRLLPRPGGVEFLSFQCTGAPAWIAAMAAVARLGVASECFGFDPVLAGMRMRRASLVSDVRTLGQVVRRQGLVGGLKLVGAGRDFLDPARHSFHLAVEGDDAAVARARAGAVRAALRGTADEIDPSIPRVLRSQPFTPPNTILGPGGERWVPVHGIVPHSVATTAFAAVDAVFARERAVLDAHHVQVGYLVATVAAQGFLVEPVFYWPDSHTTYHRRMVESDYLARVGPRDAPDPAARAVVARLRREVAAVLRAHGAVHFQIGRCYDYRGGRDPAALALFDAVKRQLDPRGLMNPGVLEAPPGGSPA
jgi:FAD/FMN-containing dehydrogenase